MPDRVYQAADGVRVHLDLQTWVYHIVDGHPEVTIDDLEEAILRAVRIRQHRDNPARRIYEGPVKTTGFHHGTFSTAVVEMSEPQVGRVVTAYLASREYKGVQLWP